MSQTANTTPSTPAANPTDGRTRRRHGPRRLVAVRPGATEAYGVRRQEDRGGGGGPSLAAAGAPFEVLQRAALHRAVSGQAAPPADAAAAAPPAASDAAGTVVSLEAYRRGRRCGGPPDPARAAGSAPSRRHGT